MPMFLKNKFFVFVSFFILVGVCIRLWGIVSAPSSLNWDEVSHGYNAYSLSLSGQDEWGVYLPTIFRAFGDYKLPSYIYLTAFWVELFGLNELTVRLTSVLAGLTSIILTFFLVKEFSYLGLFNEDKARKSKALITALVSAFCVVFEPWTFFLSRGAFEANLGLTFTLSGVVSFLHYTRTKNAKALIVSALLFGFSVWTYNSARVFVPILIVLYSSFFKKEIISSFKHNKIMIVFAYMVFLMFFIPFMNQVVFGEGTARFEKVTLLDEGAIAQIIESRNSHEYPHLIERLLYNKVTYFTTRFTYNYLAHFNPEFLYVKGGDHYQFSIPGKGVLYPIGFPFLLVGLYKTVKDKKKYSFIVITWLLAAPLAASVTREAPHVLRSSTMLPIPMFLTALGLVQVRDKIQKQNMKMIFVSIFLAIYFFSAYAYAQVFLTTYRQEYSWAWQYGYKEAVSYAEHNYSNYNKIVVTKNYGEPHEFFLFYMKYDPEMFRNDPNLIRFEQSEWFWVDRFDKFYFVNDWQINEPDTGNYTFNLESKKVVQCSPGIVTCLLITSPENVPEGWNLLETIYFLDGKPAFEIYEN